MAYNYVMSYYKVAKKDPLVSNELLDYIPSEVNIEEDLIKMEDSQKLLKAVYQLDPLYRNIILLRFYQDLSIYDISTILNRNINTVKTQLSRALKKLKDDLESGEGYEQRF